MSDYSAPPPPPAGNYGQAPVAGGDHPEGQKLLILSIVGLLCCAPINIYVLIQANNIIKSLGGANPGKVGTARIIAIVGLALWVVGLVFNIVSGGFTALSTSSTGM